MVSLLKKIIFFRGGEGKKNIKHFWKLMKFCINKAHAWPNGGLYVQLQKPKVLAPR